MAQFFEHLVNKYGLECDTSMAADGCFEDKRISRIFLAFVLSFVIQDAWLRVLRQGGA